MKVSTKELLWRVQDIVKTLKVLDKYYIIIINFIFGVGKLWPAGQMPDFWNKVLLQHSHTICLYTFTPQVQGWIAVTKGHRLHKPEHIYY